MICFLPDARQDTKHKELHYSFPLQYQFLCVDCKRNLFVCAVDRMLLSFRIIMFIFGVVKLPFSLLFRFYISHIFWGPFFLEGNTDAAKFADYRFLLLTKAANCLFCSLVA